MANEIVVESVKGRDFSLIFIYDLTALGITKATNDQHGVVYAPTPSAGLSAGVQARLTTAGVTLADFDNGDKVFERVPFTADLALVTQADVLAVAQAKYTKKSEAFAAQYPIDVEFNQHVGRILNAS